jgi:hypothetical protein
MFAWLAVNGDAGSCVLYAYFLIVIHCVWLTELYDVASESERGHSVHAMHSLDTKTRYADGLPIHTVASTLGARIPVPATSRVPTR